MALYCFNQLIEVTIQFSSQLYTLHAIIRFVQPMLLIISSRREVRAVIRLL